MLTMRLKPSTSSSWNSCWFQFLILFSSGFLKLPSVSNSIEPISCPSLLETKSRPDPFADLISTFIKCDRQVGCKFNERHKGLVPVQSNGSYFLQNFGGESDLECCELKMKHFSVLVEGWAWIPSNLDNLWLLHCGLSCLWTKSSIFSKSPMPCHLSLLLICFKYSFIHLFSSNLLDLETSTQFFFFLKIFMK